ncbi:MAG TPA: hypothetical protein VGO40_15745 [Longimicrobium sp.]|nr:hypothetical protein [Longimicrobium sp.]
MQGPPPPWFFLALFPVLAASAGIVIASIGATVSRVRRGKTVVQLAPPAPDAQVARLQAEVDELRVQVERLTAAESFYAQLQRPAGAEHARLAETRATAGSA